MEGNKQIPETEKDKVRPRNKSLETGKENKGLGKVAKEMMDRLEIKGRICEFMN